MHVKELRIGKSGITTLVDDSFEVPLGFYVCKRGNGYVMLKRYTGKKRPSGSMIYEEIYLHRFIMGAERGDEIDHIDGNKLNNQTNNLRFCTHAQNMANMRPLTGRFRGVHLTKDGKWVAQICKNYKVIDIGRFSTEEEAALAYNGEAVKLHGEFARLNKI